MQAITVHPVREALIKSLDGASLPAIEMIARRKPLSACRSIYAKGCNTASTAAANPKYIQQMDGKKRCANVVAALGSTHKTTSIICALRLSFISVFSPPRP